MWDTEMGRAVRDEYLREQYEDLVCPDCHQEPCQCLDVEGDATVGRHPGEDWTVYFGEFFYKRALDKPRAERLAVRVNAKRPDLQHLATSEYWEHIDCV